MIARTLTPLVCLVTLIHGISLNAAEPAPTFGSQVSASGIRHSFLITGSKTAIIGEDDRVLWEAPDRSRDGFVLPNGNVLVSHGREAKEYQRDGTVVFRYQLSAPNKELGTAVRLPTGATMLVERGPQPRLVEVDDAGKTIATVALKPDSDNAHMQTRMACKLPSGNYLVPHLLGFAVKEYAPMVKSCRYSRQTWRSWADARTRIGPSLRSASRAVARWST